MEADVQKLERFVVVLLMLMVAVPAMIGILLILKTAGCVVWSQEAAGWMQAIGSIAAIWFATKGIRDADRLSAKRRYDSIVALAQSAQQFTNTVRTVFHDDGFNHIHLKIQYRELVIDSLIDAIKAVSVQDLGSYNAILAFTVLREAVIDFKGNISRAEAHWASEQNPETHTGPSWQTWNATALDLCVEQIARSIEGLQKYRPDFAK
jgi:hypothetical protein